MNKRGYEQRARAETAEQTRRRILETVYQRLRVAPAESVTLDQIARQAGVARSTIYVIFKTRAGLFQELARFVLDRAGFDRITRAVAAPGALAHLRESLRAAAEVYAAERQVLRTIYSMAMVDPGALGGSGQWLELERAGGMRHLLRRLRDEGLVRTGVTDEEAEDVLWVATSFDAFDLLHTGRGLPPEEVAERLIAVTERTLLRAAPRSDPAGVGGRRRSAAPSRRAAVRDGSG